MIFTISHHTCNPKLVHKFALSWPAVQCLPPESADFCTLLGLGQLFQSQISRVYLWFQTFLGVLIANDLHYDEVKVSGRDGSRSNEIVTLRL